MTPCVERWPGARRCSGMNLSANTTVISPRWLDWRGQPISNGDGGGGCVEPVSGGVSAEGWGGLGVEGFGGLK